MMKSSKGRKDGAHMTSLPVAPPMKKGKADGQGMTMGGRVPKDIVMGADRSTGRAMRSITAGVGAPSAAHNAKLSKKGRKR